MATAHMLSLDKIALAEQAGMVQYVKRCQVRQHHDWFWFRPYFALHCCMRCGDNSKGGVMGEISRSSTPQFHVIGICKCGRKLVLLLLT